MARSGKNMSAARDLMAEVLDMPLDSVPNDARIGAFEPWDSLGHLRIMLAIETEIGRELDASEVVKIECLTDIASALALQS